MRTPWGQVDLFALVPASYETEAMAVEPVVTAGLDGSPDTRCPVTVVPHGCA
ncbi:hypothetical protein ACWCP6_20060 [Streptomyces sp. NPDC002004]